MSGLSGLSGVSGVSGLSGLSGLSGMSSLPGVSGETPQPFWGQFLIFCSTGDSVATYRSEIPGCLLHVPDPVAT